MAPSGVVVVIVFLCRCSTRFLSELLLPYFLRFAGGCDNDNGQEGDNKNNGLVGAAAAVALVVDAHDSAITSSFDFQVTLLQLSAMVATTGLVVGDVVCDVARGGCKIVVLLLLILLILASRSQLLADGISVDDNGDDDDGSNNDEFVAGDFCEGTAKAAAAAKD